MKKITSAAFRIPSQLLSLAVAGAYFIVGGVALAATLPGLDVKTVSDFGSVVICNVANWMFWILMGISVVMVLSAAYRYVISSGDAEKIKDANKTMAYAAVAIVIALLARGFPFILTSVFNYTLSNNVC